MINTTDKSNLGKKGKSGQELKPRPWSGAAYWLPPPNRSVCFLIQPRTTHRELGLPTLHRLDYGPHWVLVCIKLIETKPHSSHVSCLQRNFGLSLQTVFLCHQPETCAQCTDVWVSTALKYSSFTVLTLNIIFFSSP